MNKVKVKGIIGIILMILMFVGFFSWETIFRKNLMYDQVLVLSTPKLKGEIVAKEDLKYLVVEKGAVTRNSIKDPKEIVDTVVMIDLPVDMPLSPTYFSSQEIALTKDEFIFAVPSAWLAGYPQTLRAKDTVYFYEVKPGQAVGDGLVIENNEVDQVRGEFEFVYSSTAKYIKDGSNKEVINVGEDREVGSGTISSIEIVITLEKLGELENKIKKGSKFIVLYNEV